MEKNKNMFLSSAKELKSVPALAMCAMFAALALILNSVASINLGPYIKIGFSGIPNQIVDYLFGPITGGLFAGILDLVKYFMKPDGAFFFGFTFLIHHLTADQGEHCQTDQCNDGNRTSVVDNQSYEEADGKCGAGCDEPAANNAQYACYTEYSSVTSPSTVGK